MVSRSVVACLALLAAASATEVQQCPGRSLDNLSNTVQLTPCKKLPCRLKKGTNQHISIKFTPEKDIADVTNHVTAKVIGVDWPFVGVDGNSICEKIFTESGEKATCPLKAGTTYTYKDSFPVYQIYPSISLDVHWELLDDGKSIVCFEVPATIK